MAKKKLKVPEADKEPTVIVSYDDGASLDIDMLEQSIEANPVPAGTLCETDTVEKWFEENEEFVMTAARGHLLITKFCMDMKLPIPAECDLYLLDPRKDVFNICELLLKRSRI